MTEQTGDEEIEARQRDFLACVEALDDWSREERDAQVRRRWFHHSVARLQQTLFVAGVRAMAGMREGEPVAGDTNIPIFPMGKQLDAWLKKYVLTEAEEYRPRMPDVIERHLQQVALETGYHPGTGELYILPERMTRFRLVKGNTATPR